MSTRSKQLGAIAAGVLLLVVALIMWKRAGHETPRYRTAAAEVGSVEAAVSATGTINPVEKVEVGSQVSGTVARLNADFNSRVRKGQVLLQLDPSAFRARLAQGEASVAKANASVREQQQNLARARALLPQKYISQAEVDIVQSRLQQALADLKQARAQLQAASVDLANATIRSPIDGVVIARSIDLGQTVAASLQAPKLFVIANDLTHMQVETRIDEADIGRIRPGLPVKFTVDAFPDEEFEGVVAQVRLEPIVEQNVVTYTTVIRTENPALRLRPGMTANVSVEVARRENVLKVPNSALRFRPPEATRRTRDTTGTRNRASTPETGAARYASRDDGTAVTPARDGAGQGSGRGNGEWRRRRGGDSSATGGWRGRSGRGGMRGARGGTGAVAGATTDTMALPESGPVVMGTIEDPGMKPGAVYVLRNGKPVRVRVLTGITDGGSTEIRSDELQPGDQVIVGVEVKQTGQDQLQPPPGMGGRRGGGGRGR